MRKLSVTLLTITTLIAASASATDPPLKLTVKPLLCVIDKGATGCMATFDVRWQSALAQEYCLNISVQPAPLRCWASSLTGALAEQRTVSEDFAYWLGVPSGTARLAEVRISVLRVGSADRRRERRARHVWDVL